MDEVEEEENQEQISLMDEVEEEENQEQNKLELSKTIENIEETQFESTGVETSSSSRILSKNHNANEMRQFSSIKKSPLPNIKNLRKWINKDKKAS